MNKEYSPLLLSKSFKPPSGRRSLAPSNSYTSKNPFSASHRTGLSRNHFEGGNNPNNPQKTKATCFAYVQGSSGKTYTIQLQLAVEREFQKVEAVLDEMRAQGCQPNVITYTIMMHSLGKAKETQAAFRVLDMMKSDGCFLDVSAYNSLIYIMARAGQLRKAYDVYEEMYKRDISPNVTTFNTLISAACNHSQGEHAFKLLIKMEESSCKPDIKTCTPLLKLSCTRKWMRLLLYIVGHMFKRDISLDLGTYTLLMRGLYLAGKVKHACIFYEELLLKGFIPRSHSSAMLMEALERKNMIEDNVEGPKYVTTYPLHR